MKKDIYSKKLKKKNRSNQYNSSSNSNNKKKIREKVVKMRERENQ